MFKLNQKCTILCKYTAVFVRWGLNHAGSFPGTAPIIARLKSGTFPGTAPIIARLKSGTFPGTAPL